MKATTLGAFAGILLVVLAFGAWDTVGEVMAQPAAPHQPKLGGDLIVVPAAVGEKGQMLTVIDPKARVMSVYHVNLETGKIALRSVRNLQWDMQLLYLNNENPLPQEIQRLLEQR